MRETLKALFGCFLPLDIILKGRSPSRLRELSASRWMVKCPRETKKINGCLNIVLTGLRKTRFMSGIPMFARWNSLVLSSIAQTVILNKVNFKRESGSYYLDSMLLEELYHSRCNLFRFFKSHSMTSFFYGYQS